MPCITDLPFSLSFTLINIQHSYVNNCALWCIINCIFWVRVREIHHQVQAEHLHMDSSKLV